MSKPKYWLALKEPSSSSSPNLQPSHPLDPNQSKIFKAILSILSSIDYRIPIDCFSNKNYEFDRHLNEAEKIFCSQESILRFCRAAKWDQAKAIKRLQDTLAWRREFGVEEISFEDISVEAESGKQFLLGYDLQQRPVLRFFPNRQNTKTSNQQIKFVVWCLERAIDLMPNQVESICLLICLGHPASSHSTPPTTLSQAKEVVNILQNYYCERLGKAVCLNAPWIFWGFFKLIKSFLDPLTAEKIEFDPVLSDLIPIEHLEKENFGGHLEFQYNNQEYLKLLVELTNLKRQKVISRYRKFWNGQIGVSEVDLRGDHKPEMKSTHVPEELFCSPSPIPNPNNELKRDLKLQDCKTTLKSSPSPTLKYSTQISPIQQLQSIQTAQPDLKFQPPVLSAKPRVTAPGPRVCTIPREAPNSINKPLCAPSIASSTSDHKSTKDHKNVAFRFKNPLVKKSIKQPPWTKNSSLWNDSKLMIFQSNNTYHLCSQNVHHRYQWIKGTLIELQVDDLGNALKDEMSSSRRLSHFSH
ncbi:hypothetical protein O181_081202 [Austropuccinia psidii MF-1]|uniref:CRAL-TRIO domain-containing protein n=1 Tax=Austropuccinia psidii MF-1 TaxID=1389203 RepID=A0A9Q3FQA0_9BASI|nr:hypothetical protein [Austropuccinia psidii MF-1]